MTDIVLITCNQAVGLTAHVILPRPIDKLPMHQDLILPHEARRDSVLSHTDRKAIYAVDMRAKPNIIITGTPGVGKTTHCETLATSLGLTHLSINTIVKDKECHDGWDEEYQSWIVDEDKVCSFVLPVNTRDEANMCGSSCWTRLRRKSSSEATLSTGTRAISFPRAGLIW